MLLFSGQTSAPISSHSNELHQTRNIDSSNSVPMPQLVFLVGSPRSGTTYLAKLIDRHPATGYLHEPLSKGSHLLIHRAIGTICSGRQIDTSHLHDLISNLIDHLPRFAKPPFYRKNYERIPLSIASGWLLNYLLKRRAYYVRHLLDLSKLQVLLLKDGLSPFSHRLCHALRARMIVLLRHPCGVVNSMLRGERIGVMSPISADSLWTSASSELPRWGYSLTNLRKMQPDELHALRWLVDNSRVLPWLEDPNVRSVVYRDLVLRSEQILSELFDWLGLEARPEIFRRVTKTCSPSEWLRYFLGPRFRYYAISPRASELDQAWQKELPPDSIARVLHIVRPFPLDRFWPHCA